MHRLPEIMLNPPLIPAEIMLKQILAQMKREPTRILGPPRSYSRTGKTFCPLSLTWQQRKPGGTPLTQRMSPPLKQAPGVVSLKRPSLIAVKVGKAPELLPALSWPRQAPEMPVKLILKIGKNPPGLLAALVRKPPGLIAVIR
jgi:hypothetical protein